MACPRLNVLDRARRRAALTGSVGLLVGACLSFDPFACLDDTQCDNELGGVCSVGFCSYPDVACASGLRYEDNAGMDLGGECVALPGTGSGSSDDSDDDGSAEDTTGGDDEPGTDTVADDTGPNTGTDDATDTGTMNCGGAGQPCCDGSCDAGLACLGEGCSCVDSIATGDRHTCAVLLDGTVQCWGDNSSLQLGQAAMESSLVPLEVPGPFGAGMAATLVAARDHTCALREDDFAYCWGDNATGQVDPASGFLEIANPTIASFASGAVAVGTGSNFTCVARNTGTTTTCWGDNTSGQLTGGAVGPTPVDNIAGYTWTHVATGNAFTCGAQVTGTVHCWGSNDRGQLAIDTTTTMSTTPVMVGIQPVAAIVAGGQHVCAIVGAGVQCWGRGELGQLGDTLGTDSFNPVAVSLPVGVTVTQIDAGPNHTCAVTATDELYCWGSNSNGQLMLEPDKMGNDMYTLSPVLVDAGAGVVQVATGSTHTCVLSTAGEILCWGTNTEGQIGDGTTNYGFVPTATMLDCG